MKLGEVIFGMHACNSLVHMHVSLSYLFETTAGLGVVVLKGGIPGYSKSFLSTKSVGACPSGCHPNLLDILLPWVATLKLCNHMRGGKEADEEEESSEVGSRHC